MIEEIKPQANLEDEIENIVSEKVEGIKESKDSTKEKEIELKIKNARDFKDLYQAIVDAENIPGSKTSYSSQELIDIIERVQKEGITVVNRVTRTFGLRQKVMELLAAQYDRKDLNE